jgi:hypothetical protein
MSGEIQYKTSDGITKPAPLNASEAFEMFVDLFGDTNKAPPKQLENHKSTVN